METWLTEARGGTELRIRWSGSGTTLPTRLALILLRAKILRQTRQELGQFKRLVEAHGVHFAKA